MSRFLRWSCCALVGTLVSAIGASECSAQVEQAGFHKKRVQPVYDYVPSYDGYGGPMGSGPGCGPDYGPGYAPGRKGDCGPNCSEYGDSGSCGSCNGGYDGGCEGGPCGGGGCGPYDMGCAPCDGYCGGGAYGCDSGCDIQCDICPPKCGPRLIMFGDYLYLQTTDVDVAHAQQQDGIGGAGTVPYGDIGTIGQDFSPGFRVGGSVACGPCSGVTMSFTHFESDNESSLDAPTIPGGGGAVGSLVQHPGAGVTASVGPMAATYEIDFQLADVMCRGVWKRGPKHEIGYSIGGQLGHLDQDFAQIDTGSGGQSGAVDANTSIDFDGCGIKNGVDGERRFKHGLGVYGKLTAAAMTGRFSSRYTMYNQTTDQLLAQANWKDDRVIGHFEYELGASLMSMNEHWRVAAGYMFSYWTNAVTTPGFVDAVQADNYTDVGDTLGFNGLVGRVECRW